MQKPPKTTTFLLEGNETRRVRGTDTGSTVLDGLAVEGVSYEKYGRPGNHVL